MLTSIKMQGFRKYDELSIENIGRINFILGNNNVGKTSVLEGIYAWACGQNISPFINIPLARCRYSGIQNPYWMMEEVMAVVNHREEIPFHMSFAGTFSGEIVQFNHTIFPSDLLTEYDSSYKKTADSIMPKSNDQMAKDTSIVIPSSMGMVQFSQQPTVIAKWEVERNGEVVSDNITIPSVIVSKVKPFRLAKFIDVLSHTAVNETVQMYSSLKREKLLDDVSAEISKIFPEIVGFDVLPYPDGSQAPISILKKDGSIFQQIPRFPLNQDHMLPGFANAMPGNHNTAFLPADQAAHLPFPGNHNGLHAAVPGVELNVHHLAQPAAVGGIDHILGAQFGKAHASTPGVSYAPFPRYLPMTSMPRRISGSRTLRTTVNTFRVSSAPER